MYLQAGFIETILFGSWKTTNESTLAISCIVFFLIATFYQIIKVLREKCKIIKNRCLCNNNSIRLREIDAKVGSIRLNDCEKTTKKCAQCNKLIDSQKNLSRKNTFEFPYRLFDTLIFLIQYVIMTFLMLVVMNMNIWLFTSIVLGISLGYWLSELIINKLNVANLLFFKYLIKF